MDILSIFVVCAGAGLIFGLTSTSVYPYAMFQLPLALYATIVLLHQADFLEAAGTIVGALTFGQVAYALTIFSFGLAARRLCPSQIKSVDRRCSYMAKCKAIKGRRFERRMRPYSFNSRSVPAWDRRRSWRRVE